MDQSRHQEVPTRARIEVDSSASFHNLDQQQGASVTGPPDLGGVRFLSSVESAQKFLFLKWLLTLDLLLWTSAH